MIPPRRIIRGALTRTAPAIWTGWAVLIAGSPMARSHASVHAVALTVLNGLAGAVGSTLVLALARRHRRDDAGVGGRRAVLVGLGAFAVALTTRPFMPFSIGSIGEHVLMGVSGAVLAAAIYFPWMSGRSTHVNTTLYSASDTDALGAGQALDATIPQRDPATVRRG